MKIDVQKLIEYLQGTCNTLDSALDELFGCDSTEMTEDNHTELGLEIFLCEYCGWWCEISEVSDEDGVCMDCYESHNYEEE